MPDGVVSLVDAMGVAVVDDVGTVLRPGADRGAGDLSISERGLRHFIEITQEELANVSDAGGPFPLSRMYEALKAFMPAGYSLDEFAAAYDTAYRDEPQSLAAQVMRGQKIDAGAGLLTVQMWLLLVDGFAAGAGDALAAMTAQAGVPMLGTAATQLPSLTPPPGFTAAETAFLVALLPQLAHGWVDFSLLTDGGSIHEGHGGLGRQFQWSAVLDADPFTSRSGRVLLQPKLTKGLVVTWDSGDIQAWNDHGSFDQQLGVPITLLYNGGAELKYVPKKEDANGAGTLVKIYAPLVLRADAFDLVDHVFDLGPFRETARNLLDGSEAIAMDRIAWPIEWHQVGNGYSVSILWRDIYNGIEDDIRFHGLIINKPQNPSPGLTFEGTGRAYGSRLGWKSCNPGFEGDITGSGKASFTAGIEGDQVVIGAFADANTPLSGILAGPFILQAKGDSSVQYPYPYGGGDLTCLHSIGWDMTATAVGDPLHP